MASITCISVDLNSAMALSAAAAGLEATVTYLLTHTVQELSSTGNEQSLLSEQSLLRGCSIVYRNKMVSPRRALKSHLFNHPAAFV